MSFRQLYIQLGCLDLKSGGEDGSVFALLSGISKGTAVRLCRPTSVAAVLTFDVEHSGGGVAARGVAGRAAVLALVSWSGVGHGQHKGHVANFSVRYMKGEKAQWLG